jgi:hypothetical protein
MPVRSSASPAPNSNYPRATTHQRFTSESLMTRLNVALRYASYRWRVFPLYQVKGGACSCDDSTICGRTGVQPWCGIRTRLRSLPTRCWRPPQGQANSSEYSRMRATSCCSCLVRGPLPRKKSDAKRATRGSAAAHFGARPRHSGSRNAGWAE